MPSARGATPSSWPSGCPPGRSTPPPTLKPKQVTPAVFPVVFSVSPGLPDVCPAVLPSPWGLILPVFSYFGTIQSPEGLKIAKFLFYLTLVVHNRKAYSAIVVLMQRRGGAVGIRGTKVPDREAPSRSAEEL